MEATVTRASSRALAGLPTGVRSRIDPADVVVPPGYEVELLVAGLSFPTAMCVAEDGTVYFAEGGSTWPTRPYMPPRIWRLGADGVPEVLCVEELGGPRGLSVRDGQLYISLKGGYHVRIVRHDLGTGERVVLNDKLPSGGWHEPGGPLFGPHDGLLYFGTGSVSLQGAVSAAGYHVDLAKHPQVRDVPGQDVTLTGNNVWSRDPTAPFPFLVQTGPFKPFGLGARRGEVVKGDKFCSTAIMRMRPDGSDPELIAWGVRNPFGLTFTDEGDLYCADNGAEEKGERAVAEDPDRIWHIRNARRPHGTVDTPDWYGFPDLCGDGLPFWHESHLPERGTPATPLIENLPPWAGPAAYLFKSHTGLGKLDWCHSDRFGHRGDLFVCQFGSYAPFNSQRSEHLQQGFQVVRVNLETGQETPFMHNRHRGPASETPGSGGLERPVDCKFSPDGQSLYVLDFGLNPATEGYAIAYAHTGALWRINKL